MQCYYICKICGEKILYVAGPVISSKQMVEHLEQHVKELIDNKPKENDHTYNESSNLLSKQDMINYLENNEASVGFGYELYEFLKYFNLIK